MDNLLVIIQARSGSTRLPAKILLPFHDRQTILDIIIDRLKMVEGAEVMVATTTAEPDERIVEAARRHGVLAYRGDEDDVLRRFICAAESVGAQRIVRVCSDNPFLNLQALRQLVAAARHDTKAQYISFDVDGTPSIKTHYGFWTEYVTLGALRLVAQLTDEKFYHEHVTNYIYSHPDTFNISWIDAHAETLRRLPIRLTIDTQADFETARQIYAATMAHDPEMSIADVVDYVSRHAEALESMKRQIADNSK